MAALSDFSQNGKLILDEFPFLLFIVFLKINIKDAISFQQRIKINNDNLTSIDFFPPVFNKIDPFLLNYYK